MLTIITNANDWRFGRLDDLEECLQATTIASSDAIALIHDDYTLLFDLSTECLLKLVILDLLLFLLTSDCPVVDAGVTSC